MDVLAHCSWCDKPLLTAHPIIREGERTDHEWCYGLRMRQERDDARTDLRGAVEALREIVRIGSKPRDSMTWNRRECEARGQAMIDAANAGLRGQ